MECVGKCCFKGFRYGPVHFVQNVRKHRAYGLGEFRELAEEEGGFLIYFLLFHDYSPFSLFLLPSENPSFILHLFSQFFSQRSHLTFPFLFSSNSLNIFGTVETYFSITVPLITSVVLSPHRHVDTPAPSPPNIISLV